LEKGEEAAEIIPWSPQWCTGAPMPHVIASENETVLIYALRDSPGDWDGKSVRLIDPSSQNAERLAVVTFKSCDGHRFGGPNDEVALGHPLHGRGLRWYDAHLVHNSMWLAQEEATNSVHPRYNPQKWRNLKHYLLCFHDSTFECLAESYEIEVVEASFRDALLDAARRVLE
jgi:hypothetical protein